MPSFEQNSSFRILIADDEASLRLVLAATLRRAGYDVVTVKDGVEAMSLLKASENMADTEQIDVVIADLNMPRMDGMTLLQKAQIEHDDLPVIILTAHGTVDVAVQALKEGAFDFMTKPYERDEILLVIRKAIGQRRQNSGRIRSSWKSAHHLKTLIGHSQSMLKVHEVIEKVADSPSTVLITGESGTGKELVARALHLGSSRMKKPFISINCAAIPVSLIEAELFGYEKGAFTGAVSSKPGRFELAHEGTLFLDEIGELTTEMQVKLLRSIQESTLERVGGVKTIKLDTRIVAATNQNLKEAIIEGKFREDLFYRINVVPLFLPPLRVRKEDIPELVAHFLEKYNLKLSKNVAHFSSEALRALKVYDWPGNIRELENIVERTVLFSENKIIEVDDLPMDILALCKASPSEVLMQTPGEHLALGVEASMKEIVKKVTSEIERDMIATALNETGGNVTHTARKLKISRKSLQLKMKELSLRIESDSYPQIPA